MKTKLDMRLEAARLTIESGAETGFTGIATEIYNFLVAGIELPDKETDKDPMDYMSKFANMAAKYQSEKPKNSKQKDEEEALHEKAVVE